MHFDNSLLKVSLHFYLQTLAARLLSHSLPTLHNTQFLSCSLLAEDTINTVMDRLILGCGYSLLVLDDCDLGDQNVLRLIRNLANDVTDRPDVKSSGVIIILTTSDGGKILNKLVAERIRDRGQISGISAEDVNSALRREDPKHVSFREQVAAAPKFLLRSVPFLPLTGKAQDAGTKVCLFLFCPWPSLAPRRRRRAGDHGARAEPQHAQNGRRVARPGASPSLLACF